MRILESDAAFPGETFPPDDVRKHEQDARNFLSRRGFRLPDRRALALLGQMLNSDSNCRAAREETTRQELLHARRTWLRSDAAAKLRAEALLCKHARKRTRFARLFRANCKELIIDGGMPLEEGEIQHLLDKNAELVKEFGDLGHVPGQLAALTRGANLYRLRGETMLRTSDLLTARRWCNGIEHLICSYGRRRIPDLVGLFTSQICLIRLGMALDSRKPEAAKPELDTLCELVHEGHEWLKPELLRHEVEYQAQLCRCGQAPKRTLEDGEEKLKMANDLYGPAQLTSPCWQIGGYFVRMELLDAQGKPYTDLLDKCARLCSSMPHIGPSAKLRRLYGDKFRKPYAFKPTYASAGLPAFYLDDRLIGA